MHTNEILDEKYLLKRQIGEGGCSVVYEAEHLFLGKRVALKLLSKQNESKRLKAEARALAALSHRNIVQVLDFGEDRGGHCYYVMEYVEGKTLQEKIDEEGALSLADVLHLLHFR